jgi:hypothetical protein
VRELDFILYKQMKTCGAKPDEKLLQPTSTRIEFKRYYFFLRIEGKD